MTTHAVPTAVVPSRPAWHGLLWTVPLTVLWGWLIYWQPPLVEGAFPAMAARLMSFGLIALGLWFGLEAADLTPGQRRATWLAIMVPFTLWAAAAWTAAINGIPHGILAFAFATCGDLSARDRRRTTAAVVETSGAGA